MCNWFCSGMEDNIVVVTVGCHGSVLFRSVCAAVIIGVAGPDGGPGGCSQNAGAHRVSSISVFHFSVFSIGSFVVLSFRMAARTPICSMERGYHHVIACNFGHRTLPKVCTACIVSHLVQGY